MAAASSPSSSKRCSRRRVLRRAAALASAVLLSGCASVRHGNSLGLQETAAAAADGPYFVIASEGVRNFDPVSFNRILHSRYPGLFAQTPDAVPVMIRIGQGGTTSTDGIGPLFLGIAPMIYTCGLAGVYWQDDRSQLDVGLLLGGPDEVVQTVEVEAERRMHGLLFAPVARLFQPPEKGWHKPHGDLVAEEFEGLVEAIADALARTLGGLSPEQRAALRRNPVALQRFQQKFPWGFGVRESGVASRIVHVYPAPDAGAEPPAIVSRSFDAATRSGEVVADFSGREYVAAQRWLVNDAIPRLCRERLGREVSLVCISGESLGEDQVCRLSFTVVE